MRFWTDAARRSERLEIPFNQDGVDPFGIEKKVVRRAYGLLGWFYHHYFSVQVHGIENVPPRGRAMLVGNHSGGVALDAAIVVAACFFEMDPPRLAQGMADKFLNRMPFSSKGMNALGHHTGLPEHATRLLENDRLLLVFPEGARGTAKLYREANTLVRFGTGFVRLALQTGSPILPFGFVGGGKAIPTVVNAYRLGRIFGFPYLPITPYLAPAPLPVRLAIELGEPMRLEGTGREDDEVIEGHVAHVKDEIARLIDRGVARLQEES